jgi:RNA polymerase sigma-70 factor (ECF subfamily)
LNNPVQKVTSSPTKKLSSDSECSSQNVSCLSEEIPGRALGLKVRDSRATWTEVAAAAQTSLKTAHSKSYTHLRLFGGPLELFSFNDSYLQRLKAGDPSTQHHFVTYFSQLIAIKLRARYLPADTIDDVRQETFLRILSILRKDTGVQHPERFGAFVNSVCNNVLLEQYRSSTRAESMDETFDPPDKTIDMDRALVTEESQRQVHSVLEKMPERDRRLLRAIFLEEIDKDQICKEYGVDRGYLRVLVHRAKQQFRSLLGEAS